MKNERGSDSDIQMRTVRSVHVRRATYCMHRCLRLCAHLLVYTDCLSELQMTLLLIRNDARTNGDSREKSQKPKVQKGNASIKIFIKTTLFTQSSMTNDSPLPVWLFFFLSQDRQLESPWLRIKANLTFFDRAIFQKGDMWLKSAGSKTYLKCICQITNFPEVGKNKLLDAVVTASHILCVLLGTL